MKKLLYCLTVALVIISCKNGNESKETTTQEVPVENNKVKKEAVTVINLSAGDQMQFSEKEFLVKKGQEITLNFENKATLPKESMGHNVVILQKNTDKQSFANEAINAKNTDYIPQSLTSKIIAHTKLLGPGEKETIKFTIQEAGNYPFICSFPGHWGSMNGVITVE